MHPEDFLWIQDIDGQVGGHLGAGKQIELNCDCLNMSLWLSPLANPASSTPQIRPSPTCMTDTRSKT